MGGVRDASGRACRRHILVTGPLVFGETPTSHTTSRPLLSIREAVTECEGKRAAGGRIDPRPTIVSKSLSCWQWSILEWVAKMLLAEGSESTGLPGTRGSTISRSRIARYRGRALGSVLKNLSTYDGPLQTNTSGKLGIQGCGDCGERLCRRRER